MKAVLFKIQTYSGLNAQHLRNVHIYAPSIIWVKSGVKTVFESAQSYEIDGQSWLLTSANQALSFINRPSLQHFYSVQLSLFLPPSTDMIEESKNNETKRQQRNALKVSSALAYGFSLLVDMSTQNLSQNVQKHHLLGFYQQLLELGVLHVLFSASHASFQNQLSTYFSKDPAEAYQLEEVCHAFSMSRATLMRRLHSDGTNFRTVLSNVRMGYALALMQERKQKQLDLALQCGYHSESRFSQRFQQQFGLTPKQYMKTIPY